MTNQTLFSLENAYLNDVNKKCSIETTLKPFQYDENIMGIDCTLHSIISCIDYNDSNNCKKHLIFIHGTYASSLGFVQTMKFIKDNYKNNLQIHAIDLPGFGISAMEKELTNCPDIIDFYCTCIQQYIQRNIPQNQEVYLMGHSFGGYLCINFVDKNPETIAKLLLIDVVGIFPMLGSYGNYWGIFFKFNILSKISQFFGKIISINYFKNIFQKHYFTLLSNDVKGYKYIGSFIHFSGDQCQWSMSTIDKFLKIYNHIPICLIYGKNDNIIPYTQGEFLHNQLNSDLLDLYIIPNAGHAPYADNNEKFCESVIKFIDKPHQECRKKLRFCNHNLAIRIKETLLKKCYGSFFISKTNEMIKLQYELFSRLFFIHNVFYST